MATPVPSLVAALPGEPDALYLGSPVVVDQIVREFINEAMRVGTVDGIAALAHRMGNVFSGFVPPYSILPLWHQQRGLGAEIAVRLGIDPDQAYHALVRGAFLWLAVEVANLEKENPGPIVEWGWQLDALIEWFASLLIGTLSVTHPDQSPWGLIQTEEVEQ